MRTWILATLVVAGMAGCGKQDSGDKKEGPPPSGPAPTEPAKDPTAPPAQPPAPATPTMVDPASIPADKPLSVAETDAYLKPWGNGAEVTVTGYATFYIGDSDTLSTGLTLASQPGQKQDRDKDLHCDVAPSEKDKKVDNKTPLTIKGELRGRYGSKPDSPLWLMECVVTAQGTGTADLDKLMATYNGWFGKEITVAGYFGGVTVSSKTKEQGGAIIDVRIDLLRGSADYDVKVGCHLPLVAPTAEQNAQWDKNRPGMIVKGRIKEVAFDSAQLDPCTVISK